MKNKTSNKLLYSITLLFVIFSDYSFSQSNSIKLIAFNNNLQNGTSIVRWTEGDTQFNNEYPTNVEGIISASSTFDSRRGKYFARVFDNTAGVSEAKLIQFNTNNETISLLPLENIFNGGSEVDMQSGFVYTYESDNNNVYLSRYNPNSGTQINLGNFTFSPGTGFFPDSTCYDSNSKIFYFLILEDNQVKLVSASVQLQPFSYTVVPIANSDNTGNIGMEFSNETNTIYTMYSIYDSTIGNSNELIIGSLNPSTGVLSPIISLDNIYGYQFSNRTYDQESESMIFVGFDEEFNGGIYVVNTATANYEIHPIIGENLNELESDNTSYAEAKYSILSVNENTVEKFRISPNPAQNFFNVDFEGTNADYQIFDVLGKIVQTGTINNESTIDVSDLTKGIYVFKLKSETKMFVEKIIIN